MPILMGYTVNKIHFSSVICPICRGSSPAIGLKDANVSCNDHFTGVAQFPRSGLPVQYHQCSSCGFMFTADFDRWTPGDFAAHIYNSDYGLTDPPFEFARPMRNAKVLSKVLSGIGGLSILDYGSGNGLFAGILESTGFSVSKFDPYHVGDDGINEPSTILSGACYDMVTMFEVVEHVPRNEQRTLFQQICGLLKKDGAVFFSTRLNDGKGFDWWYVAPRNGHISIHSEASLRLLADEMGMQLHSFNEDIHIMFRTNQSCLVDRLLSSGDEMDEMAETFESEECEEFRKVARY